jgi:ABC-2 type transport system ATP-binding protein
VIVSVENLSHKYGSRAALSHLSFSVGEGEIFGILGPNGGGKSTLFRILSTMMAPAEGRVYVGGADVDREPARVRKRIGVVFQSHSIDKKLTVLENLTCQGRLYGLRGEELRDRVRLAAERLGIADRCDDIAGSLSGGLQRRVEIAKALLHRPAVVLMDEPSTGLDPGARRELWQYVEDLRRRQGVTVLLTTHILDEADRCDRLMLLHEGRKVAEGTPDELKAKVGGDVVVLETVDTDSLAARIRARFNLDALVVDGTVRVETIAGHRFISEVVEAFPGEIQSIAMHKPTLEDVFLDETGVRLE